MPKLVQDEAGQIFVDTGGGVLKAITEDQALTIEENQGMGKGLVSAVGQGVDNVIAGGMSLFSDNPYWQQAYQQGRARSEALNLQHGAPAQFAQFVPQTMALVVLVYAVWFICKRRK